MVRSPLRIIRFADSNFKLELDARPRDILWLEARRNYTVVHLAGGRNVLVRSTFKRTEELVRPYGLVRCQRSFIVNPEHVCSVQKDEDGHVFALMDCGEKVPVSRRCRILKEADLSVDLMIVPEAGIEPARRFMDTGF